MQKHPIAGLPFDKRRLFAHEAMAVARVVNEAIKTNVVCEPAKMLGLWIVFGALGPSDTTPEADAAEATLLAQTLENELTEPDPTLLRVMIASMRANPAEDALDRGDVIDMSAAAALGLTTDDVIDAAPRRAAWTPNAP